MSIPSTANDLRRAFTGYFAERGHSPVESASLIPHDPTVLFTVAGMVLFPYTSSALACVLVFAVLSGQIHASLAYAICCMAGLGTHGSGRYDTGAPAAS